VRLPRAHRARGKHAIQIRIEDGGVRELRAGWRWYDDVKTFPQ